MKPQSTQELLSLGMALTADQRTMERRIRGIFARRSSAASALAASALFITALLLGCFTTACRPGETAKRTAPPQKAEILTAEPLSVPDAAAVQTPTPDGGASEARTLFPVDLHRHERARTFPAPAANVYRDPMGSWTERPETAGTPDAAAACAAFLPVANALFGTDYTASDVTVFFFADDTGHRASLWRIESGDGKLVGALEAGTLAFLSADYLAAPSETPHASYTAGENTRPSVDATDAVTRVTAALGAAPADVPELRGGYVGEWELTVALADGRFVSFNLYADERLTLSFVGVHPDRDCMEEGVYWRADLISTEGVAVPAHPADFRKGTPGREDLSLAEAYAFYAKFLALAGLPNGAASAPEPNATFYVDYSGARENYWHLEGSLITFDLTSRTKHVLHARADTENGLLGEKLGLTAIPYEQMGNDAYIDATTAFFTELFGPGSVVSCQLNAVYDGHYCTIDPVMADGTSYEIMYYDGMIQEIQFFSAIENGWGTDPNWAADWIYTNTETGELFHMSW